MNIYYRVTQVDTDSQPTIYELEIPFQNYYITIYTATTHLPHKRLAKYRPLSYFMIFSGDVLGIEVYPKGGDAMELDHMIEIEKPNRKTLKLLIEKVGGGISRGAKLGRDIKPEDIVNEFLKTLLIE
jgi:hypothetical protein